MAKKILLADDSVTIQKVVELTFMDQDYEVTAVGNGDAAIAALEAGLPHLVIADVHMPGADGYAVCRRAKELSAALPVMLLVGTFEPFEESEVAACGANGYLRKPFDSTVLLADAERLLAEAGTDGPDSGQGDVVEEPASSEGLTWDEAPVSESTAAISHSFSEGGSDEAPLEAISEYELSEVEELPEVEVAAEESSAALESELAGADDGDAAISWDAVEVEPEPLPSEPLPSETLPAEPDSLSAATPEAAETPGPMTTEPEPLELEPAPWAAPQAVSGPGVVAAEAPAAEAPASSNGSAEEELVERIARRVVELMSERVVREVAWDVIPDLAEVVIRDRIRELEADIEA